MPRAKKQATKIIDEARQQYGTDDIIFDPDAKVVASRGLEGMALRGHWVQAWVFVRVEETK